MPAARIGATTAPNISTTSRGLSSNQGLLTKVKHLRDGTTRGGVPFSRGPVAQLLKNPLYIGKVHHKGELFEGQHQAIINHAVWEQAERVRLQNGSEAKLGKKLLAPSLLTGIIIGPDGRPMSPSHCVKGSRRYRYYQSREAVAGSKSAPWRVPAGELEAVVTPAFGSLLERRAEQELADGGCQDEFEARAKQARSLTSLSIPEQRSVALESGLIIRLSDTSVSLSLASNASLRIELPARLVRRGYELRLLMPADQLAPSRNPDPVLLRLVAQAAAAEKMMLSGKPSPAVARYGKRHLWQLLRICWLAPDIINAIVEGTQPPSLTGRKLLRATNIPLDWAEQRAFFGFN